MMGIAEMVLPEMAMKMVAQFMHDTNGLVYSGTGFTGKIIFPQGIHPKLTLSSDYHLMISPPGQRPMKLNVSVVILEILEVNEPKQVFKHERFATL